MKDSSAANGMINSHHPLPIHGVISNALCRCLYIWYTNNPEEGEEEESFEE